MARKNGGRVAPFWERKHELAQIERSEDNGIRLAVFHGDDELDPCMQLATVWRPPDGNGKWVVLKKQPVLTLEDVIEHPQVLSMIEGFVATARKWMNEDSEENVA